MIPSLPIPTDNIYKFACLFGLVLIVSSIFAYISLYSFSTDRKIKYIEEAISLQAKTQRSQAEDEILKMNKNLIAITDANRTFASYFIGILFGLGGLLSCYGAVSWYKIIQKRDNKLADLQIKKLESEIAKIESELKS